MLAYSAKKIIQTKTFRFYISHIQQVLVNVVGQQAARNGAMKVFEILQDGMLNKVLAYEILEIVCKVLFPELAQEYKQE